MRTRSRLERCPFLARGGFSQVAPLCFETPPTWGIDKLWAKTWPFLI